MSYLINENIKSDNYSELIAPYQFTNSYLAFPKIYFNGKVFIAD